MTGPSLASVRQARVRLASLGEGASLAQYLADFPQLLAHPMRLSARLGADLLKLFGALSLRSHSEDRLRHELSHTKLSARRGVPKARVVA